MKLLLLRRISFSLLRTRNKPSHRTIQIAGHRRKGLACSIWRFEAALAEYRKALDLDRYQITFNYAQTLSMQEGTYEPKPKFEESQMIRFCAFIPTVDTLSFKGNYAAAVEESEDERAQNHPESARLKRKVLLCGWPGYLRAFVTELEQNKSNPWRISHRIRRAGR
jgi:hypothetical protein